VEGQTEEDFVKGPLRDHLFANGYDRVDARLLGNARQRNRRGGIKPWAAAKRDIVRHLREDRNCIATTFVDFYGMPADDAKGWPGREEANALQFADKAKKVEQRLLSEIEQEMGLGFDHDRFVPFVAIHKFEGLLFSDCGVFADGVGRAELKGRLQAIRDEFNSPEEINDSVITAPSKRIQQLMPNYSKIIHGSKAALEIGLAKMRTECPHFDGWLQKLETLGEH
jgi:hypothetical protein